MYFVDTFFHNNRAVKMGKKLLQFKCEDAKVNKWKWFFNHGPLPPNAIHDEVVPKFIGEREKPKEITNVTVLHMTNVRLSNSGTYECEGYEDNNLVYASETSLVVSGMLHQ